MDSQNRPSRAEPDEMAQAVSMGAGNNMDSSDHADSPGSDEPMKITAIYDNGGRTLDRYTVLTNQPYNDTFRMALGIGADPMDFSQWTGVSVGDHLGVVVAFEKLSAKLQEHITNRVFGKDK
jgi:hypothetical protein